MNKTLLQSLSIAVASIGIIYSANTGAFAQTYFTNIAGLSLISTLLIHYFSKRNLDDKSIISVQNPSLISSLAVYLVGVLTFQLIFKGANSFINPLWGMTNDNVLINWPLSVLSFIFPAQFLGSRLWECSNSKSRKVLWFTSFISGTYLYAGFVLSGII